jgi:hypothetical protein
MNIQQATEARTAYIAFFCGDEWEADTAKQQFAAATLSNKDFRDLLSKESFLLSDAGKKIHGSSALWKSAIVTAQLDFLARTV